MADDASLPTYFQFRPVFINNLHFLGAHLGGYLPHNLRQVQTLCAKEEERGSRFDKWMSGDETKISRSMKGERGRGKSINPTAGCFRREGKPGWETEGKKGRGGGGGKRKIASRLCSVKGEITHLRRFFQATTGSIDQAAGFMSQFSTWNIDTENPFYPCLLAFSRSFSLSPSLSIKRPAVCGWVFSCNL